MLLESVDILSSKVDEINRYINRFIHISTTHQTYLLNSINTKTYSRVQVFPSEHLNKTDHDYVSTTIRVLVRSLSSTLHVSSNTPPPLLPSITESLSLRDYLKFFHECDKERQLTHYPTFVSILQKVVQYNTNIHPSTIQY